MRKIVVAISLASLLAFFGIGKKTLIIHAQTLPVTKTLNWDAGTDATSYIVFLDGTQIGTPTTLSQVFTITTAGNHSISVTSVNTWGTSSPTTLAFKVVLPGQAGNLRIP